MLCCLPAVASTQEDIEPRVVGSKGTTSAGISGFVDHFASTEDHYPWRASLYLDLSRFITSKVVVRGGLAGTTTIYDDDDESTGAAAPSVHGFASALYFFTPQSIASFYSGAEYRAQLNRRADRDAGTVLGIGGIQAQFSSRAALFIEGGYGVRLTKGDEGETLTRITGQIGLRIRF